MGLRIKTNIQSLQAQRNLSGMQKSQNSALSKLSSGERIVKSGDDAAGLAISEKLKAQIRGNQQATRNAGDGISFIQTAEGGMNEVSNILIRLRELSVQAASDTVGETERQFSDYEYQHLVQEVDRIAQSTQFNGRNLLNGEGEDADFQVGINNIPEQDRLTFIPAQTDVKTDTLNIASTNVLTKEDSQTNLEAIDTAITLVNGGRANLGALQNRLESTINNLEITTENLSAANSRIRDADIASESAELAKSNILSAASTSVLAQANQSGKLALNLIG